MKQLAQARYEVVKGEVVTLRFKLTGIDPALVVVVFDGAEPPLDPTAPAHSPTYKLTITATPPAFEDCDVECSFPAGTPAGAKAESFLKGSKGGGEFTGPTFNANFPGQGIVFEVVAAQGVAATKTTKKAVGAAAKKSVKTSKKAGKKTSKKNR